MSEQNEVWRQHHYLVEWVDEMNSGARKYQIYEFVKADESGEDPTGRIPSSSLPADYPFETEAVWTVFDSSSEIVVTTEFSTGMGSSAGVIGWFLGRVPHNDERIILDYMRLACEVCEGQIYYADDQGDELECERCLDQPMSVWLEETDFQLFT